MLCRRQTPRNMSRTIVVGGSHGAGTPGFVRSIVCRSRRLWAPDGPATLVVSSGRVADGSVRGADTSASEVNGKSLCVPTSG